MSFYKAIFVKALIIVLVVNSLSWGQLSGDWPQFLGPNRNGLAGPVELLDSFPATGPEKLWTVELASGMSGLAVAHDQVFTLAQDAGGQFALALNLENGKVAWKQRVAEPYKNSQGDGPRATPTVVGDAVIVFTGQGWLVSLDRASGKPKWQVELVSTLGGSASEYGMSCSPLVVGDIIVVQVGAPQAAVVGVSLDGGAVVWKTGDGPAGYSSPCLINVSGESHIVALIGNQVLGIDATSGRSLWSYPFVTDYNCNTANPITVAGKVLVSAGEDHGSALLEISQSSNGYKAKTIWESLGVKSSLRSEWQTPIAIEGVIYGFDNVGGAGPVTHLVAVDAVNGSQLWRQPRFGKCNAILADGKLIMSSMTGELILATVNRDGYQELDRAKVNGPTRQAPVLAGSRVLLRDDISIVCLQLSK